MPQSVTLELPDSVYERFRRMAEATTRNVEDAVMETLSSSLPPAKDIRQAFVEQFGEETVGEVDVRSYPGDEYFANVKVSKETNAISDFAWELSDRLQELGLNIGIICHEKPAG
jgi:hypothetical protein